MHHTAVAEETQQLERLLAQYLPESEVAVVRRACELAAQAHGDQLRASGEPYITHPLSVATTLAGLRLDTATIAAALLHDVVEDTFMSLDEIAQGFGPEVAQIVDGVTKLTALQLRSDEEPLFNAREAESAENLRKMFLAMAEDLRVVLVKLADRLHNMQTLQSLRPEKQRRIAQETLDIYAPLANRLGIWEIKWQLEDLSFRYLEPEEYKRIAKSLAQRRVEREEYVEQAVTAVRAHLAAHNIHADVLGRPKHLYSIYHKMKERGSDLTQIYDLLAVRVIVETIPECYNALGVVHGNWHPLPGQIDDYIATPKDSGYQSLHTTVVYAGKPLEIQIRTRDMHQIAEYGVAAHWRYKEGKRQDAKYDNKIAWLRQLMDWHKDVAGGAMTLVDSLRTDVFQQQVYIFTPKGEIKELPASATPLDFAYRIHTEIGHRCVGAKVNGRLVPLTHHLQNGDIVEIVTSKTSRGPSRDWLIPAYGYLQTAHAREKVRQWFRKSARDENITQGRELLDRELKRLGLTNVKLEDIATAFHFERLDDFFAAMGYGDVHPQQLASRLTSLLPKVEPPLPPMPTSTGERMGGVRVNGVGDLFTRLARCCNPVPGDSVIGFITRGRGVTVHRDDCASVRNEDEPERLVEVQWGDRGGKQLAPVTMRIIAHDREGLLRDIGAIIADEQVNISGISLVVQKDHTAVVSATVDVPGLEKLSRVMARVESIRDVLSVRREG